jgi:SAM-dependent methyltransferase
VEKVSARIHFDKVATDYDYWKNKNWYYYFFLKRFLRARVRSRRDVLELGCGTGQILASLDPRRGLGVDVSEEMVQIARAKFPDLTYEVGDIEHLNVDGRFDYVVMVDLIDHVSDIWAAFGAIQPVFNPRGRLLITTINPLWEPLYSLAESLRMKMPEGPHNFVPLEDICNLLVLRGFSVEEKGFHFFVPRRIPLLTGLLNAILSRVPILRRLGMVQYVVAKPKEAKREELTASVVIPCLNEAQGIRACLERVPFDPKILEIIVVDDGSTDGTADVVHEVQQTHPRVRLISYQPNRGKCFAVQEGFRAARGDVLIILDADMSVPPEEIPRFLEPIAEGHAHFVNGTRMTYPMEAESMRFLNLLGNKVFGLVLSGLMGQRITDCLCGTKALLREDFERIPMGRDPWGDFDLLFGAARQKLTIVEMPVHYRRRVADLSKMKTFRHGLSLLKMCFIGLWTLRLHPWLQEWRWAHWERTRQVEKKT